jgi:hypothetical protein
MGLMMVIKTITMMENAFARIFDISILPLRSASGEPHYLSFSFLNIFCRLGLNISLLSSDTVSICYRASENEAKKYGS